jgi:hypothetical protein
MHLTMAIKGRILRIIESAGYVVTKVADHYQREQLIAELAAERATLAKELDLERGRARETARKLSEADHAFRLGRARDASELEAARVETWEQRMHAAQLQRQLDAVRRVQEARDRMNSEQVAAAEPQLEGSRRNRPA